MPAITNIRVVRRKIRAVGNIKKITRAMQMVAAAKLRKVQDRLMAIRPYADKIHELLHSLAGDVRALDHPLFSPRENVERIAVVVIMSDKGLCGSYNSNMTRFVLKFLRGRGTPYRAMPIGKKSVHLFRKENTEVIREYTQLPTEIPFSRIQRMSREVVHLYTSGEVDEVHFLFTRYINAMTFQPTSVAYLPIKPPKAKEKELTEGQEFIFEPEPRKILERLVPRYLEVTFHRLLLEAFSSEHAARMNAMQNATKNAQDLIESLTLTYNKARQAGITKELLDIVGGAEALRG